MRTQQDRSIFSWNLHLISGEDCFENRWPVLDRAENVPKGLVTFQVSTSDKHPDEYCHFFIDDYRFERLWNTPERYLGVLKRYSGAVAPDFSTFTDMPEPMQIWNVYRSRALARYWQTNGIDVIPCVQFAGSESYKWCFDGLPARSVLACSTVGIAKNPEARANFKTGIETCIHILRPKVILVYGSKVKFECGNSRIVYYKNDNTKRVQESVARAAKKEERHGR